MDASNVSHRGKDFKARNVGSLPSESGSEHKLQEHWQIEQAWQGHKRGYMKTIWWKLRKDKIEHIKEQLYTVQTEMIDHNVVHANREQERGLRKQLEKWSLVEESVIRQKSRVQWLNLGNAAGITWTGCFMSTKCRYHYNEKGRKDQQIHLAAQVTRIEMKTTLQNISDLKAPGIDGLNVVVFKRTWPIVGEEIIQAILKFFDTGEMYQPVNCTAITLIPKVENPTRISCYLLYSN
ncbi:hypothetical protein KY289_030091 [Solanum tuberosum]|nr:hypothetical protein KY289_030091 [Solanum tuberosum]